MTMDQVCFQFKASFSPCTILQMIRYDLEALEKQLADTIARAPNFFIGSPVIIDLEKIKSQGALDFPKLKEVLRALGLVPMGVRGGSTEQIEAAATTGLPLVNIGKNATAELTKPADNPKTELQEQSHMTKLVTTPIRGGMQVYAKNGDLIVVAQVSPGAELLSDGHIHVYGPLRGRALAGVQGDINARIFCRTLEAELVSIAGFYLTKDDMQTLPAHNGMIQIYLDGEQVRIEAV